MTTTSTSATLGEARAPDAKARAARPAPVSHVVPRYWIRNGWTLWHALGAVVMTVIGVVLTFDAFRDIFNIAMVDEESSHIFLVPIIAVWLVWVRRERLRFCTPRGHWIGPALILAGWFFSSVGYSTSASPFWGLHMATIVPLGGAIDWVMGALTGRQLGLVDQLTSPLLAFWHGGSVLIVIGCLITVLGRDVFLRFLPAFVVLAFLVPVPGAIRQKFALPLQAYLAQITEFVFNVLGGDVYRDGHQLTINGVPVAIAEACNGLRMVFALVLVSYAFAFGTPLRNYVRGIIVLAALPMALFCNVLRMIPTVWLYGESEGLILGVDGKKVAEGFHDFAGWIMLVVAFLLLMSIIRVLRWALIPVTPYTLAYD